MKNIVCIKYSNVLEKMPNPHPLLKQQISAVVNFFKTINKENDVLNDNITTLLMSRYKTLCYEVGKF